MEDRKNSEPFHSLSSILHPRFVSSILYSHFTPRVKPAKRLSRHEKNRVCFAHWCACLRRLRSLQVEKIRQETGYEGPRESGSPRRKYGRGFPGVRRPVKESGRGA